MAKELFVSSSLHETRVAVLDNGALVEVYFQREQDVGLVSGIYKGRVNRVLPGMQSAFVEIGLERDAFLYVSDFYEESDEYEKMDTDLEQKEKRPVIDLSEKGAKKETDVKAAPAASEPAVTQAASEPSVEIPPPETSEDGPTPELSEETPAPAQAEPAGTEVAAAAGASPGGEGEARSSGSRRRGGRGGTFRRRRMELRRGRGDRGRDQEQTGTQAAAGADTDTKPQETGRGLELLPGETLALHGTHPTGPSASPVSEDVPEESPEAEATNSAEEPQQIADLEPIAAAGSEETEAVVEEQPQDGEESVREAELEKGEFSFLEAKAYEAVDVREETTEQVEAAEEEPETSPQATASDDRETAEPEETSEPKREAALEPERKYTLREPDDRRRFSTSEDGGKRRRVRRGRSAGGRRRSRPTSALQVQISKVLKQGQEILVQIAREPLGTKGARITSHIALPGRHLVYMPTESHIGVSRKISSEEERLRLRNTILEEKDSFTGGFIVRTAAEGASEQEIKADVRFLSSLWNDVRAQADAAKSPALIHGDASLVERILRDILTPEFKQIWVDSEAEYERVVDFVHRGQPDLVGRVKLYQKETPLYEEFGIQAELEKALSSKVWLKSGGYIVINETEALVAIDVNTGKFVGRTNRLEDTILKTNVDAIQEIVRQVRLRDLGGIIVIDFIDMDERRNRNKVLQVLEKALKADRAPSKVLSFNDFGLVAITRKRVRQSLTRSLCTPCSDCDGSGWVKSPITVCNEIYAEVRKMAGSLEGDSLSLRVHPDVARHLKVGDGALLHEMELMAQKDIIVKSDPDVHQARFEIF